MMLGRRCRGHSATCKLLSPTCLFSSTSATHTSEHTRRCRTYRSSCGHEIHAPSTKPSSFRQT
eukprot:scaffold141628_cov214-Phaeocystis_antarctica.AAC.2